MTDIVKMSKDGTAFYPQTHYLAILELDKYVKSLVPDQVDTSSFVTSESMSEYVLSQLKSYALAKNIPDVSAFITKSALDPYALKEDIPSLDGYAKSSDIPKIDLSDYVKNEQLSGYAELTDIPNTTDFVKKSELDSAADVLADEISVFNYYDATADFKLNSPTVFNGALGIAQYKNKNGDTTHGFVGINVVFQFNNSTGMPAYSSYKLGTLDIAKYPAPHSGTDLIPRIALVKDDALLLHMSTAGALTIATQSTGISAGANIVINSIYAY